MEKETNYYFIHKDLQSLFKNKKECFFFDCINDLLIKKTIKIPRNRKIIIIDKTFLPDSKPKQKIYVNNHVNKTGENPIRGNQDISLHPFFDITSLYKQNKNGVVTAGLGKNYTIGKKENKYPSTYLLNIAILCRAVGFQEIEGILISLS